MKLFIFFLSLIFASCANITSIYNTQTSSYLSYNEFIEELKDTGFIIMGEFHNNKSIQQAQAKIIRDKVKEITPPKEIQIMWEFLNFTDQSKINKAFYQLPKNTLNLKDFTSEIAGKNNLNYTPIIAVAKELNRPPVAINLPREIKQKVMKEGINSVDQKYVPINHYLGGTNYRERFSRAMINHASESEIEKYFLAQSLTDSVMADIASKKEADLNFVIAGSFHTDFYDGMISKLKEVTPRPITTLKLTSEELMKPEFISGDKEYGPYADYVIITR